METFQAAAQTGFEAEALEHIRQAYPLALKGADEPGLRQMISRGVKRARQNGFKARGPVQMFLDFLVLLGHQFDQDPVLFWAADILQDRDDLDEMTQAARLHLHVSNYIQLVYGRNGEHIAKGLERLAKGPAEELTQVGRAFETSAIPWLQCLHPRKCAYSGTNAIGNLMRMARDASERSGLPPVEGPPLLLVLMFGFGSGVLTDPLFPWVAGGLQNGGDATARLERLTARTVAYMRQALENRTKG